jgi:phosphotransferase system  glucose/maltose/N-acetylglucosamine-specific IIC component
MMILFFWIAGAIATGMFAHIRRGREGIVWFVLALIISPLLAFVFCAILRDKDEAGPVRITREEAQS